jgi:quercetin dioxygenase-like cupin family protein
MVRDYRKIFCFAFVFGGALLLLQAQSVPVELIPLAAGSSTAKRIRISEKGPSDVLQAKIVIQPNGDTGWHTHPGSVIVVVTSGVLTEHHSNGCKSVYQKGDVFLEEPGIAHRVVNSSTMPGEAYATFVIPAGTQPLMPTTEPPSRPCSADSKH